MFDGVARYDIYQSKPDCDVSGSDSARFRGASSQPGDVYGVCPHTLADREIDYTICVGFEHGDVSVEGFPALTTTVAPPTRPLKQLNIDFAGSTTPGSTTQTRKPCVQLSKC